MPIKRRRYTLGSRPLTEIPLSGSLLNLSFKVWETRRTIKKPFDIYKLYSSITGTGTDHEILPNSSVLSHYFACIGMLAKESGLKIKIQDLESISYTTMVNARYNYIKHKMPITCPRLIFAISRDAERNHMSIENYHLIVMQTANIRLSTRATFNVMHHVYINVSANKCIQVLKYVVFNIIKKIEGVRSVKFRLENLSDKIIIYTKNITVAHNVVYELKKYQQLHGVNNFHDKIPYMAMRHIPGVGTGAQPPNIHFEQRQPFPTTHARSFGSFRADLIYRALKNSTESYDFFELIVKYFKDAGIDANDPSIQTSFQQLESQARINLVQSLLPQSW
ncbi:MAG: hypothetical protein KAH18_03280 [Psychromonas sp.]|nr:hypothetical protein [Psychromonas sp.]